jgi:hypothetical protein
MAMKQSIVRNTLEGIGRDYVEVVVRAFLESINVNVSPAPSLQSP